MGRKVGAILGLLCAATIAGHASAACTLFRVAELPVTMTDLSPIVHANINGDDVRFIAATAISGE